ncbi:hypothetical protein KIPE111705_46595 [Kibdelosporangium persicum]
MHGVIRQPRVSLHRQTAGQQHSVRIGQLHRGRQQRMPRRPQSRSGHVARRPRRFQPVPPALEWIRREVDHPRIRENRTPIHPDTVNVRLSQRGQQSRPTTITTPQRPQRHSTTTSVLKSLLHPHNQHRMRTHLNKHTMTTIKQSPRRLIEPDSLPKIPKPIISRQLRTVDPLTSHRGIKRHTPRPGRDPRQIRQQPIPNRLHLHRMRRIINRNPPSTLHRRQQPLQRLRITRNHRRTRPIHRSNRQPFTQ